MRLTAPETEPASTRARRHSLGRGNITDQAFKGLTLLVALSVLALAGLLVFELTKGSMLSIRTFGFGFLSSQHWDPVHQEFGVLPLVFGTLVTSLIAVILAVPISIGIAIFLTEVCPLPLRRPISFLVDLLAAIPSIVYGLWGLVVLVPWIRVTMGPSVQKPLGWFPLFGGPIYGIGVLAAGLILAIMIVPIISAVSREVISSVPQAQKEGMLALGATRWETVWKVVLPFVRTGLVGAVILGLGRALGETMAVTMVIGNRHEIVASLFSPSATMASTIANEFTEATYKLYISSLIEVALVLMILTLMVNILARTLVWRFTAKVKGERTL